MIKAIIFDWRRTLFNDDQNVEFSEAEEILKYCHSHGYRLAVVSLVSSINKEKRVNEIEQSPLREYFELALVTDSDKNKLFNQIVEHFNVPRSEIFIVGDRIADEIKYGNISGHPTVWLKKGKFSNELPADKTEEPTYIISDLRDLQKLL